MADAQDIARAFAPFIAIEEFENVISVNSKTRAPIFLRRNLSYSATHQNRVERDQKATAVVTLRLETMTMPSSYKSSLAIVAAVCAVVPGSLGPESLVPLAAKIGRLSITPTTQGQSPNTPGGKHACTLSMKVPLPGGVLPKDTVVLVLHKKGRTLSRLTRMILRAKHRGSKFNSGGREVTCTLKDGTLFSWFNSGDNVLYSLVQPSEEMCTPEGTGTFKRGVMELQPGVLSTANGSIQPPEEEESRGLRQSWTEERHVPASFIIRAAAVGDATPILRYTLALDAPTKQKKRKRDSEGGNPTGPGSSSRRRSSTGGGANGGATAQPVAVNFCSEDGSLRVKSNLRYGFDCPFESCGMRCRSSITALQHHLMASHPYYEYFVTAGEAGPEVWVRCRREWFGSEGTFLPTLTFLPDALSTHPLTWLLFRTSIKLPFEYRCPRPQRWLRLAEGSRCPQDGRELEIEKKGVVEGVWVFETAPLAPREADCEEGKSASISITEVEYSMGGTAGGNSQQKPAPKPPVHKPVPPRQKAAAASHPPAPVRLPLTARSGLPKFYHSGSCMAMTAAELERSYDSDDDSDTDEYQWQCSTALEEKSNLCPEERTFMLAWNLFTHKNPIYADADVHKACVAFAEKHAADLIDGGSPFRRCFVAHLTNLWKFRLLTPSQMHKALNAVLLARPSRPT